jgi:hypothetical protein
MDQFRDIKMQREDNSPTRQESSPKSVPAARVLECWQQQVADIPSTFGRLAFLAGLKNSETARYTHYQLTAAFGADEADKVIRRTHLDTFAEWLSFRLERQQADLNVFMASVDGHRRQILAACAVLAPHVWCIPDGVAEHERRLYLADLEAILEPLYSEYGLTASAKPKPVRFPGLTPSRQPLS